MAEFGNTPAKSKQFTFWIADSGKANQFASQYQSAKIFASQYQSAKIYLVAFQIPDILKICNPNIKYLKDIIGNYENILEISKNIQKPDIE